MEYIIPSIFIIGLLYGFLLQLQEIIKLNIIKANLVKQRRLILGIYLSTICYAGFFVSFLLNLIYYLFPSASLIASD